MFPRCRAATASAPNRPGSRRVRPAPIPPTHAQLRRRRETAPRLGLSTKTTVGDLLLELSSRSVAPTTPLALT
ncbi:hypothetical protein TPA0910_49880 [Streptomyces hygroscopicus subsp. sporocinereus]|uniref:Uncharacterized protein n=1 Tax=Streptomyces hygroscopicus TaxID=1912 RepID=A0ABQ3U4L0_STRHY|nr:hypothetical protein TPA0910_49880 [Streptomyces hygroscopicus]